MLSINVRYFTLLLVLLVTITATTVSAQTSNAPNFTRMDRWHGIVGKIGVDDRYLYVAQNSSITRLAVDPMNGQITSNAAVEITFNDQPLLPKQIVPAGDKLYVLHAIDSPNYLDKHLIVSVISNDTSGMSVEGQLDTMILNLYPNMSIINNHLLITDEWNVLVVDVTDPSNPRHVADIDSVSAEMKINIQPKGPIAVQNQYAFIGSWRNGVIMIDMSDPENPVPSGGYGVWGAEGTHIENNLLYADGVNQDGIVIFDITDPLNGQELGMLGGNWGLSFVRDGLIYAGNTLFDARDPNNIIPNVATYEEDAFIAETNSNWLFAISSNRDFVDVVHVSYEAIEQPTPQPEPEPQPAPDNFCPESGVWPAGCTPRPTTPSPSPEPQPAPDNFCPESGKWPAGCVPVPTIPPNPQPQPAQPCPEQGRWPQGCIPRN